MAAHHEQTRESVAPHLDALAAASADLARITQRVADLTETAAALWRLNEERAEIGNLRNAVAALDNDADVTEVGVGIYRPHDVAERLNEIFHRTLTDIDLPRYAGRAYIDPSTLLPYVDGPAIPFPRGRRPHCRIHRLQPHSPAASSRGRTHSAARPAGHRLSQEGARHEQP
ncbi:hypothetical protein ABTX61_08800 [Amycolatopsis japonica]|uniref:hypothetical protein n=1 Tax=Amycolatopsis japonica TaxID=208439 RepID=UPI0033323CC4